MQHLRTNVFIAAWALLLLGTALVLGLPGPNGLTLGAPSGLVGVCLLLWALGMKEEPEGMSPVEIARWTPEAEAMPPGAGGSVMYRVDTTLDSPVRTSILCGACGHLDWVDGPRPGAYACLGCGRGLWEEEE